MHFHQKSNPFIAIRNYDMEVMVHGANECKNAEYFFFNFHFNVFLHFKYIAWGGGISMCSTNKMERDYKANHNRGIYLKNNNNHSKKKNKAKTTQNPRKSAFIFNLLFLFLSHHSTGI